MSVLSVSHRPEQGRSTEAKKNNAQLSWFKILSVIWWWEMRSFEAKMNLSSYCSSCKYMIRVSGFQGWVHPSYKRQRVFESVMVYIKGCHNIQWWKVHLFNQFWGTSTLDEYIQFICLYKYINILLLTSLYLFYSNSYRLLFTFT